MPTHKQIVEALLKPECLKGGVPPNITLDQVLNAVKTSSTATLQRRRVLAKAVFRTAENGNALASAALAAELTTHFTNFFTNPNYRRMSGLMQHMNGGNASEREQSVLSLLSVWLAKAPPAPQPSLMRPIADMTDHQRQVAQRALNVDQDGAEPAAVAEAVYNYMLVPQDQDADDIALAMELWQHGQAAAAPQAAPQALQFVPDDVANPLGLPPPPADGMEHPPAAQAGGGDGPHAHSVARYPHSSKAAGAPALASTSTDCELASTLLALFQQAPSCRKNLLRVTQMAGSLYEPPLPSTFPPAMRPFFMPPAQNLHPGGVGHAAAPSTSIWSEASFQLTKTFSLDTAPAAQALDSLVSSLSFDESVVLGEHTAGRCLILDSTAHQHAITVTGLNTMSDGATDAIPFLFQEVFRLVDTDPSLRRSASTTADPGYTIRGSALQPVTLKQLLGSILSGVNRIADYMPNTSTSLRPRTAALAAALLLSFNPVLDIFNEIAQPLIDDAGAPDLHDEMSKALAHDWLSRFVLSATLSLGNPPQTRDRWNRTLGDMASAHARATRPVQGTAQPARTRALRTTQTPKGYWCPACSKGPHHVADCWTLRSTWQNQPDAWLRAMFKNHVDLVEVSAPPACASGDDSVNSSYVAFKAALSQPSRTAKKRPRGDA